ncbi:MAG: hypothetical protein J6W69_01075, partial [Bacteroidales bacterium]|nr:hypothetical protein [Bacteroidales bacterium]
DFHNATSDEAISLSSSAQTIGKAMVAASTGTGTTVQITAVYTATINGDTRTYERTGEATLVAGYKNQINVSVQGDMPLTINAVVENMEPIVDGHVYVDLGLPSSLLWATMNVGASKPEEYGDYFAWGETESKEDYSWQTYKYCNGTQETLTKYVPQEMAESFGYEGYYDTLSVLELADDAAHINWGVGWKTPSDAEWQEIFNACTYEAINEDGVIGAKLISSYNGKSIFFSFAGFMTGTNWQEETLESYYWGTGVRRNWPVNVSQAVFQNGSTYVTTSYRNIGLPVRAVHPAE